MFVLELVNFFGCESIFVKFVCHPSTIWIVMSQDVLCCTVCSECCDSEHRRIQCIDEPGWSTGWTSDPVGMRVSGVRFLLRCVFDFLKKTLLRPKFGNMIALWARSSVLRLSSDVTSCGKYSCRYSLKQNVECYPPCRELTCLLWNDQNP